MPDHKAEKLARCSMPFINVAVEGIWSWCLHWVSHVCHMYCQLICVNRAWTLSVIWNTMVLELLLHQFQCAWTLHRRILPVNWDDHRHHRLKPFVRPWVPIHRVISGKVTTTGVSPSSFTHHEDVHHRISFKQFLFALAPWRHSNFQIKVRENWPNSPLDPFLVLGNPMNNSHAVDRNKGKMTSNFPALYTYQVSKGLTNS